MDQRFAVTGVEATTPLAEAAAALMLAKADPLFALEDSARAGASVDAVHDMRVASRRLRETMRLLAPLYPTSSFAEWYQRVRAVTKALGPVRDSDVFIEEFSGFADHVGEGGRKAIAFLIGYRIAVRERELERLERRFSRLDLGGGRKAFRKVANSIGPAGVGARPLAEFAHAAVAERAAIVFGAMPEALIEERVLQQHALRIDFKRLRYAVEVFAPVYGDDFDALHDTLTAYQDTLGDLHDLHIFADMLREPARLEQAGRAGVTAEELGEVVALLDRLARERFSAFSVLAAEHPAHELLGQLLLPLVRRPVQPVADASAESSGDAAAEPSASEAASPPAPPAATAAPDAPAAPDAAVVLEAPAVVVTGAPQLGDGGHWSSDAAGLSIDPPIVIGAEPWARTPPVVDVAGEAAPVHDPEKEVAE